MKCTIAIIAVLSFAIVVSAQSNGELFRKFIKDNKKIYTPEEFPMRFANFKANVQRINELNSRPDQTATFGINKFSDLSKEEFASKYLLPKFDANDLCIWPFHAELSQEIVDAAPLSFDWRAEGAVTPVKNQEQCGSCWTFSTTGNIEGQWFLGKKQLVGLSEQWIVDCSVSCLQSDPELCNAGCDGGLPWLAYGDIITNKGITTEAAYPYTAENGDCQTGDKISAVIANWTVAPSTNPVDIQAFLVKQGPLSITINADMLMSYMSGIITGTPSDCPVSGMDHAVLLVGYGKNETTNYWTVKNSWGTDWGVEGYFQIQSDQGLCGINACVTTALLQ